MNSLMSSWISESSSPNRNSASVLDSSVLPTPDGPAKMNEPPGRFGSFRPARVRRIAWESALMASLLADDPLVQLVLHAEQPLRLLLGQLEDRDAGGGGQDLGDQLLVDLGDDVHVAGLPLLLALRLLGRAAASPCRAATAAFSKSCESIADSFSRRTSAIFSSNSRRSGGAVIRRMRIREPASSIRSIALSGRNRSLM